MCFKTTKSAGAKIAKTDIKCWKVINRDGTNALSRTCLHIPMIKYEKNKACKKEKLRKTYDAFYGTFVIDEGYHSFHSKNDAIFDVRDGLSVEKGFYCYRKFIIPKGTRYFSNRTEYVSETIIML